VGLALPRLREMGKPTEAYEAIKKVEKCLPLVASMLTEELAEKFQPSLLVEDGSHRRKSTRVSP